MTNEELLAALQALLAQRPPTGGIDPLPNYTPYPNGRSEPYNWHGLIFQLRAPINPKWSPSTTNMIFRKEPSNGDVVGRPLRDSDGWPIWYTREGRAVYPHGDRMFDSSLEVESYLARVAERDANLNQVGGQWSPR